jgi:S-DNA-T family DNA segregation ATPase FtsK/SpoIIIE
LAGTLALAAGAESCRVARAEGKLLLELPKPLAERRPLHAHRLEALVAPTPTAVPLGVTTGCKALWCDLADERFCHVVIGGTTGSGKSLLARWLLYRLLRQNAPTDLRLLLVDPKRFEFAQFAHAPHLLHPVTSQPLEIARVLSWVGGELDRRAETGRKLPRIVVCIEEVADILSANRSIGGLLARIAQIGCALGVHAIVTTQQPGSRSLGDSLVNYPARLLGRVASETLTYGAAGREKTGAHALLGRGDFLLLATGETARFQAPLVDGRQYGQLPRGTAVATLVEELPHLVEFADLARDGREGRGRRELTNNDYAAITAALRADATADDLRGTFGIGWERARRLFTQLEEER